MSFVSIALARALEEIPLTQTALAQLSGIERGMLNRYVKGAAALGPDNLTKLVAALPTPHKAALVAGFARDIVPDSEKPLVSIHPVDSRAAETAPVLPEDFDADFRDALHYLAQRGVRHPQIRDMVLKLVVALRGS